jgi:hypothetical protein
MLRRVATEDWTPCYVCGVTREVGGPSDAQWLWVEVERLRGPGYWQAVFCSEEHAAKWFSPPMPPADHMGSAQTVESGGRRALRDIGCTALVLGALAMMELAVFGAVSLLTG